MEKMHIPEIEYDADLEITTSTLSKMIDEFAIFDEKIHFTLGDETITLKAGSAFGNMTVALKVEDVEEYAVEPESNLTTVTVSSTFNKFVAIINLQR